MFSFGWMMRLGRFYARTPKLVGFSVLALLIVGLSAASVASGFSNGFWPNLYLNAAGDMVGGMIILLMIEPIVSRAAVQIRQHPHLDFRLFTRRIAAAEREIRVLDTFSSLFDSGHAPRSLAGLQEAVMRGVNVRVLLMSPATDASRLRQEQLDPVYPGLSIDAQIHSNISALATMERLLGEERLRVGAAASPIPALGNGDGNGDGDGEGGGYLPEPGARASRGSGFGSRFGTFELRLYSVAAPFTLYQRDDTLMYAMLPAYQFAHDAPQLEINAGSLAGIQILEKFDEVWQDARPVRRLAPVRLSGAADAEAMWLRFIELGDTTYYVSNRIDAALAAKPDQHFWIGEDGGVENEAESVPRDTALYRRLLELHDAKYTPDRRREPDFYQMWPSAAEPAPRGRTLDFDRLPTQQILERLARAERSVRILDTSSILIGQDGDEDGAQAFVRAALAAMANGATIKILLLAPTTSAARERAKEIRDQRFDRMVERNIERLRHLARQLTVRGIDPDRLRVRLYDQLTEISLHQTDDRVIVGFLPYRRRSSLTSQLETERHSELGVYAVGQFELLWGRARPLNGLRYVTLRATDAGTATAAPDERLLVRAWPVRGTWHVASARIEELLAERAAAGRSVTAEIEDVPDVEFRLSDPLVREANIPVWDAFAETYAAAEPGVPVRALTGPPR